MYRRLRQGVEAHAGIHLAEARRSIESRIDHLRNPHFVLYLGGSTPICHDIRPNLEVLSHRHSDNQLCRSSIVEPTDNLSTNLFDERCRAGRLQSVAANLSVEIREFLGRFAIVGDPAIMSVLNPASTQHQFLPMLLIQIRASTSNQIRGGMIRRPFDQTLDYLPFAAGDETSHAAPPCVLSSDDPSRWPV